MSMRFAAQNVFDDAAWKVIAANTLQMDDRRRFTLRHDGPVRDDQRPLPWSPPAWRFEG